MDADTAIGGPHDRFPSTRISLLEAAAAGLPNEALERVIALYWKPVYRFIRLKFRKDNEDAKDLTQSFFTDRAPARFFRALRPGQSLVSDLSPHGRRTLRGQPACRRKPAEARRRRRVRTGRGTGGHRRVSRSRSSSASGSASCSLWPSTTCARTAKNAASNSNCSIFEAYDLADGERPSYAELAARHGIPETSVTNHLAWARRMLRDVRDRTVARHHVRPRELREEMRRVWI